MKHLAFLLVTGIGLALTSCGGASKSTSSPRTAANETRESDETNDSEEAEDEPKASEPRASADASESEPSTASGSDEKTDVSQEDEKTSGECQKSDAKLGISVDRESVNLERGALRAKMAGPICTLKLKISRKDGLPPVEKSFRYSGSERELRWNPVPRDQIEKIEIRVTDQTNGYQAVLIVPWSVRIEHKELEFDTNKAVIRESEVASLEDSLAKIKEVLAKVEGKGLGTITLFIAGHTDTVGTDEHNLTLSRNRAQSIANWFLKRGLCIPIAFEGFGETALRKVTPDNVDEQANRRADYILAVEPPMVRKGVSPAWKWISKGC